MSEPTPELPGLARRMACFIYEGLLLFGVAVVTALIFSPLVGQRNAMDYRPGLMAVEALAFAAYFVFFWTRGGQTLAMKTWHIKLECLDGSVPTVGRALLRHILSYGWWLLPVMSAIQLRKHGLGVAAIFFVGSLGIVAYALLAKALPGRQFLHDVICGTRLVTKLPVKKKTP